MKTKRDYVQTPFAEPGRKNPASGVHIYSGQTAIVFLTVRTLKQSKWLAGEVVHELICETWRSSAAWHVGDYILMPDHLHLFCAPHDVDVEIEDWILFWKRKFRRLHNNSHWRFQSRGWHHRLRSGERYSEKWRYMMENPVRRGLVEKVEDWPHRGRVFDVRW